MARVGYGAFPRHVPRFGIVTEFNVNPVQQLDQDTLYDDTDVFFSATINTTVSLFPSLHDDTDTFFAPTVTTGSVTLSPPLVTDDDVFFSATLAQVTVLQPSLITDDDTFFSATVTTGSVTLTPGLYDDSDAFFAPVVSTGSVSLDPGLSDVPSVFFDSVVTQTGGSGDQTLFPDLFINVSYFLGEYVGGVDEGGGKQRKGRRYIEVDSSNIHSVYYDDEGILRVKFNSGPLYAYKDVPVKKVARLVKSRSPGAFLHKNIVNKYQYRKMS